MKTQTKDYYALLGIAPDAALADIKRRLPQARPQIPP